MEDSDLTLHFTKQLILSTVKIADSPT